MYNKMEHRQIEERGRGPGPIIVDLPEEINDDRLGNMQVRAMWYRRQLQNDEVEIEKDENHTK